MKIKNIVIEMAEIPPGLKKRWKEFAELSRKCWDKVEARDHQKLTGEQRLRMFWQCMETGDPIPYSEVLKCERAGIKLSPHPICVIAKVAEGLSEEEAAERCLREGKVHPISYLACKARLEGEL